MAKKNIFITIYDAIFKLFNEYNNVALVITVPVCTQTARCQR